MSIELLKKLQNLQRERSDKSPFANSLEFEKWSDEVTPLLSFNEKIKNAFTHNVKIAKFKFKTNSPNIDQINESIGILNQAATFLETGILSPVAPKSKEPTSQFTVKWIYENATWKFYVSFFTFLAIVFTSGVKYSEFMTKKQNDSLSIVSPQQINIKAASSASSATTNNEISFLENQLKKNKTEPEKREDSVSIDKELRALSSKYLEESSTVDITKTCSDDEDHNSKVRKANATLSLIESIARQHNRKEFINFVTNQNGGIHVLGAKCKP